MWIFAVEGFVSVVEVRDKPGHMLIRGRNRDDVAAWWKLVTDKPEQIRNTPHADYPWRFVTTRKKFALALVRALGRVHYPNFKGAVGHEDPARARCYYDVWEAMRGFDDRMLARIR